MYTFEERMELFDWCNKLKPGQAINLNRNVIVAAAETNIKSFLFDGAVRQSDIDLLLTQINSEKDLHLVEIIETGEYKLSRGPFDHDLS